MAENETTPLMQSPSSLSKKKVVSIYSPSETTSSALSALSASASASASASGSISSTSSKTTIFQTKKNSLNQNISATVADLMNPLGDDGEPNSEEIINCVQDQFMNGMLSRPVRHLQKHPNSNEVTVPSSSSQSSPKNPFQLFTNLWWSPPNNNNKNNDNDNNKRQRRKSKSPGKKTTTTTTTTTASAITKIQPMTVKNRTTSFNNRSVSIHVKPRTNSFTQKSTTIHNIANIANIVNSTNSTNSTLQMMDSKINNHNNSSSSMENLDLENERTFLSWLSISVLLGAVSIGIIALTENDYDDGYEEGINVEEEQEQDQEQEQEEKEGVSVSMLYGLILLPVSIAFLLYAIVQYIRRASMIRNRVPGPYEDIIGPFILTIMLMLSMILQLSIKMYSIVD